MRARISHLRSVLLIAALSCGTPLAVRAQGSAAAAPPLAAMRVATAEKLNLAGVPNLGRVNDFLYRGAQPLSTGYDELKHLGVGLVVDLHNRGAGAEHERLAVESRGMRYVSLPASATRGPTEEQIAEFLTLVRENQTLKIFVHCKLGADRSGVMIAAFRMTHEHWTPDQALAEMRSFHFHYFWLPTMIHTVRSFPKSYETSPVFATLRLAPAAH
jgi:tyrosine-protein phosphatase SIW14